MDAAPALGPGTDEIAVRRGCEQIASSLLSRIRSGGDGDAPASAAARAITAPAGRKYLRRVTFDVCSKHRLPRVPKNHEILSALTAVHPDASADELSRIRSILIKKPAKTASGVAVVAVMPKPFACPHGRCTYCPGGPEYNTPNSYTGAEPPAMDAISNGYDPVPQIRAKLEHLDALGHDTSKTEVVIVGGTFLFMPAGYRYGFVKSCYDALNGVESATLGDAQLFNERAAVRNVGLTIETKPDHCKAPHIDDMLEYGVTRVEIGLQSLRDSVYEAVNRGHTYADVVESFQLAKDAGYKIAAHMMPGLPTMTPDDDIADFARLYDDPDLRPDMLKIYPSLVIRGTGLYDEYVRGRYTPYSDQDMIRVLAEAKRKIPKWVRIMRVQREIPPSHIVAGPKRGNLRQLVRRRLAEQGTPCRCIRCREAGIAVDWTSGRNDADGDSGGASASGPADATGRRAVDAGDLRLDVVRYESSGGREAFISYEDGSERIYGFVRLRRPSPDAHRPELSGGKHVCMVRELHVYGRTVGVGNDPDAGSPNVCTRTGPAIQHMGLGRGLMAAAEDVARSEFGARRMLVISAVGTRPYYARLGYLRRGPYMSKELGASDGGGT